MPAASSEVLGGGYGEPDVPLDLAMLPFSSEEAIVPGMCKQLLLYEPRYISLLEDVSSTPQRLLAHVVMEQRQPPVSQQLPAGSRVPGLPYFEIVMACLLRVTDIKFVSQGARVVVQAEGRLALQAVTQVQPFFRGTLLPLRDPAAPSSGLLLRKRSEQLYLVMQEVQNLAAKFKCEETVNLQRAMYWVDAKRLLRSSDSLVDEEEWACRLSMAALQDLPLTSDEEKFAMARRRLSAMETMDTAARLTLALETMTEAKQMLAAKCAIKSILG